MHIIFDIFVVIEEKREKEIIGVTTVFNDALTLFLTGEYRFIEAWCEGARKDTYRTIEDMVRAGKVQSVKR